MVVDVVTTDKENHMNSTKTLVYRAECHACDWKSAWAFDRFFSQSAGSQHTDLLDNGTGNVQHVTSVHWSER
jgi:hypothetical protein